MKRHKNVLLKIPPLSEADVDALICDDTNNNLSSISTQTPYETIVDTLHKSKAVVGPGYKLVNKDLRVSKFTLARQHSWSVSLMQESPRLYCFILCYHAFNMKTR